MQGPGTFTNINANTVVIFGPTGTVVGLYVYRVGTTPALGNPPVISITQPGATHDPFGNSIKSGVYVADTNPARSDYIQIQAGSPPTIFVGTGDAAESAPAKIVTGIVGSGVTRSLAVEMISPQVSGGTGVATVLVKSQSADLTQSGYANMTYGDGTNSAGVIAQGGSAVITAGNASGQAQTTFTPTGNTEADETGFTGTIPSSQSDVTQFTVTQALATQFTNLWPVPANNAKTGTHYRLSAQFNGTQGSTAETLEIDLTAFNHTVSGTPIPATFAAINTNFGGTIVADVVVRQTGNGTAVVDYTYTMTVKQQGATSVTPFSAFGTTSLGTTTSAENLSLSAKWGATTGAPTITCTSSLLERLGA